MSRTRPCSHPELAAELARRGWYQRELAAAAGIHHNTVYGVLHGRIRPTSQLRERIARALDREAAELFADEVA